MGREGRVPGCVDATAAQVVDVVTIGCRRDAETSTGAQPLR